MGEALIGCVALLRSRPHIRSVGLPRKLRLLARKEGGVDVVDGFMSLREFCIRPPEPYNNPNPHHPKSSPSSPHVHNLIHRHDNKCACHSKRYMGI